MSNRIAYDKVAPAGLKNLFAMEGYLTQKIGLDNKLRELVKIRVSQINGCAFCLNMHTQDARKIGETEQRLNVLVAWRETSLFTATEEAALALAEKLTRIADNQISEVFYQEIRAFFDEKDFTDLVLLITQINTWNRISIVMANEVE